jgi:hypothetical protein
MNFFNDEIALSLEQLLSLTSSLDRSYASQSLSLFLSSLEPAASLINNLLQSAKRAIECRWTSSFPERLLGRVFSYLSLTVFLAFFSCVCVHVRVCVCMC